MYHIYFHFVPLFDFVEELSHHFSRLIVACFDVFGSDSVAVWGFAKQTVFAEIKTERSADSMREVKYLSIVSSNVRTRKTVEDEKQLLPQRTFCATFREHFANMNCL